MKVRAKKTFQIQANMCAWWISIFRGGVQWKINPTLRIQSVHSLCYLTPCKNALNHRRVLKPIIARFQRIPSLSHHYDQMSINSLTMRNHVYACLFVQLAYARTILPTNRSKALFNIAAWWTLPRPRPRKWLSCAPRLRIKTFPALVQAGH